MNFLKRFFLKRIVIVSPQREIIIEVPLFGKIRHTIQKMELKGQKVDLIIMDEVKDEDN